MKNSILLFCFTVFCFISVCGQINHSNSTRLNNGWEFVKNDLGSVWEAVRPVKNDDDPEMFPKWENITLPHCFNAEDAVAPDVNYYQGTGWYRTYLAVENPYVNGRTLLHFEGTGQKTKVFVYMQEVGSHTGGYDEWTNDITDAANDFLASENAKRFNGKIPLIIRCDNSRDTEMIPSDLSDFNLYGGIYRYLNLVYVPSVSFGNIHADASVNSDGAGGKLIINADFIRHSDIKDAEVSLKIIDAEKQIVHEEKKNITGFLPGQLFSVTVNKPRLWSPSSPYLYRYELTLTSSAGNITNTGHFGFRHFEFQKNGPFLLNGERLLLRGTHRHEDHAGVGAAMTEEQIVEEMKLMKSMGVNFIRLGHYQQSRTVLEQCDKLGMLVWEEIPWCRGGLGGVVYQEQAKRMLTNMIVQHRNHPSVILWGLGNENDWPNDFPEFDKEKIRAFMRELNSLAHELDASRLTCIRRCDFCKDIVDVYSPSIWAGWYRGMYTDYKSVSYNEMKTADHFLHVEWGGDNHARRHAEDPYIGLDKIVITGDADERAGDASLYGGTARASKDGDWSESYICDLIDWHLKEQETMPWLTGTAYWPFKDFSTPIRPDNPVPYVNQKGVVERDFTPKEAFFVFQSYWTNQPMIRIYGHTWPVRWGTAGESKTVKVYSNCEEAELFLNGESLGKKKRNAQDFPAAGLRWDTSFVPGVNHLKAVGVNNGTSVADSISFRYQTESWGDEAQLELSVIEETESHAWIEVLMKDKNGVLCLNSKTFVSFEAIGDGKLVINQGTSTGSRKVQLYNGRAKVKLNKNNGKTVVVCKAKGVKTAFLIEN